MSSVSRFIRQIPASNTYYAATNVLAAASTLAYEFTPSAANTVGNYPPGTMTAASVALQGAIAQASNNAGAGNLILRDMGKTIQAQVGSSGAVGSFRQVQLLNIASAATFGVLGAANTPNALTDYLTFYVPVVVLGISNVSGAAVQDLSRASGSL
uniref:Uncharacterized protein n=1 Tax=viral metagenome TaxID=1070528 RepID=A0A6C0DG51_9ZZZZ